VTTPAPPVALTIAGSDSGGGAGIQADLKTFAAHGVYGVSAITAVTAQDTSGVVAWEAVNVELVTAQIEAVAADFAIHAVKTGMLATSAIAEAVAAAITMLDLPFLVVDPVQVATSGAPLVSAGGMDVIRTELLPRAFVVTPNIPEAEALSGLPIRNREDRERAARAIHTLGPANVILTGGHGPEDAIEDLLFDGERLVTFRAPRIAGRGTHGTGCTFSAALAAHLALGRTLHDAIPRAQAYIAGAIARALPLGRGPAAPMDHLWPHRKRGQ